MLVGEVDWLYYGSIRLWSRFYLSLTNMLMLGLVILIVATFGGSQVSMKVQMLTNVADLKTCYVNCITIIFFHGYVQGILMRFYLMMRNWEAHYIRPDRWRISGKCYKGAIFMMYLLRDQSLHSLGDEGII